MGRDRHEDTLELEEVRRPEKGEEDLLVVEVFEGTLICHTAGQVQPRDWRNNKVY